MKVAFALVFCALIGLSMQAAQNRVEKKADATCDICKNAAALIKNLIGDNFSEDEIEEAAKAFCQSVASEWTDTCTNVILPLVKQIYEDVKSQSAEDVCKALSLC